MATLDAKTGQPVDEEIKVESTTPTSTVGRQARLFLTEPLGASFQSPWFWFILGAGCAFGAVYLINKHK